MCGGGGGGTTYDPTYQQNIQNDKDKQAAALAATAQSDAATASAKQSSDFDTNLANSIAGASGTASNYFGHRGVAVSPDDYNSIINSIKNSVPALDPNPAQYFSDDAFASGIDKLQTADRQRLNAQVNTQFAPGFENMLIPQTSVDPILASILGDQQKTAQTTLDFNQKRGLLNDAGYTAANTALGQQGSAGKATLAGIGNSVLGVDRGHLTDIRGQAGDAASNYSFGQPEPDFASYYNRAQTTAASDLGNLEGSIRGTLGNTNLFDPATALQKGGIMQGPINLTTAAPGSGGPAPKVPVDPSRSLGSTGAF